MTAGPVLRCLAPGKVNLTLFVGAPRADGMHPLASVVQAVTLADELTLAPAAPGARADEVICPAVEGENLAARALAAFRAATGWDGPPQVLTIDKRVPVAAGMGGGSSDAAAALRLAAHAVDGAEPALLHEIAARLGGDVPSLLTPGRVLMTGAGERVRPLRDPGPFGVLVLPSDHALSTPAVYRAFDGLGAARGGAELDALEFALSQQQLTPELVHNDLQAAALSLHPPIAEALAAVEGAGAAHVMVSGSGPTVFGLFPGAEGVERAQAAAEALGGHAAHPVPPGYGQVREA
jgi:4-diphosphocytidyl-2-C-methyl-D-erythritol kinase